MRLSEEEYARFLLRRRTEPREGPRAPQETPEKFFMGQIITAARLQGWLCYERHPLSRNHRLHRGTGTITGHRARRAHGP